jgi:hypothetical protein
MPPILAITVWPTLKGFVIRPLLPSLRAGNYHSNRASPDARHDSSSLDKTGREQKARTGLSPVNAPLFTTWKLLLAVRERIVSFSYVWVERICSSKMFRSAALATKSYWMSRAAASISWARGRTRTSSVKFSQRTMPERSTRNSAGREMSWPSEPAAACRRPKRRMTSKLGSERKVNVRPALRRKLAETSGGSTLMATGRTPRAWNSGSCSWIPRNSRTQKGHQSPR